MCVLPVYATRNCRRRVEIKGIADGGEDGSFTETRAGRREVIVTELQTLARPTLLNEKPLPQATNEIRTSRRARQNAKVPPKHRRSGLPGARRRSGPARLHTVLKVDCFFHAAICMGEFRGQPDVYSSRGIKVRVRTGGKELPTPKNRMVGAGTEMVPVDTWVTSELLVMVCDHVPEAK